MNNNIDKYDDLDIELQDIEQMLGPKCEFRASESLKDEVMNKARLAAKPRRTIRLWPWVAAACVAGVIALFLLPPKTTDSDDVGGKPLVAKVEKEYVQQPVKEEQPVVAEVPETETNKTQKRAKQHHPASTSDLGTSTEENEPEESPVQMSEETRMELLMAYLSSPNQEMQREIDPEEEVKQLRLRGERMLSQIDIK